MDNVEQIAANLGFPVVILPDAAAGSVESAIRFLVECLIERGFLQVESADEAVNKILKREMLGSTAVGEGAALPHSGISGVDRLIGIFAHCASPVPWESPDGQKVRSICLLLAPIKRPALYLRALNQVVPAIRRMAG